jgi:putative transposase
MARFRLYPTAEQEAGLLDHCGHARYVWNLALEQQAFAARYRRGPRRSWPKPLGRCRELTEARAASDWLAAGSVTVQQQALRDFDQAMRSWFGGTKRLPTWRKAGQREGFRIVGPSARRIEQINRRWSRVLVPKVGWVKFRRSRPVPDAKSYRVNRDQAGRWHIAFTWTPPPIEGPSDGTIVGVDRGVAITAACSDGRTFQAPSERSTRRLARRLSRAERGSNRRTKARTRLARAKARNVDARKDWVEKTTTELARTADLIRLEDLRVAQMTRSARGTIENPGRGVRQKAGLNRAILSSGWGAFARRLEDKAPGRVEKVNPAYTSQTCSACRTRDRKARESQAVFRCRACGYADNADVNAAKNIAAGHAVTARGGSALVEPVNREPQHAPPLVA